MVTTACPGLKSKIEQFAESEGTVVQGKATSSTVITVEITLAVANAYPVGYQ